MRGSLPDTADLRNTLCRRLARNQAFANIPELWPDPYKAIFAKRIIRAAGARLLSQLHQTRLHRPAMTQSLRLGPNAALTD